MGVDWQTKCAPTWKRSWSRGLSDLSAPSLFPANATDVERTMRAQLHSSDAICVGETLIVRRKGRLLSLEKGNMEIATIDTASDPILSTLSESKCDVTTCVVSERYEVSNCIDVILEE